MRVVVVNPNATQSMTDAITRGVERVIGPCTGLTNIDAPPAIQGPEDGARAVPGVLRLIRDNPADAHIIACFDDTALAEAREETTGVVIGIGQASYHVATLLRPRFAVVTTLPVSVPVIEENIGAAGFGGACLGVVASGVPVLALEEDPETSFHGVSSAITGVEAEHGPCAVILGCAGMGVLHERIKTRHPSLILDPVTCAARLVPALSDSGLTHAA